MKEREETAAEIRRLVDQAVAQGLSPVAASGLYDRLVWSVSLALGRAEEAGRQAGLEAAAGIVRAEQQRLIDAVLMLPEGSEVRARAAARVETAFQLEGQIEARREGAEDE